MISVDEFLTNRFAGNRQALKYHAELWRAYNASNLADPHFEKEITSGNDVQFW